MLFMQYAMKVTEARTNYSTVLESVVRVRPQPIQRLRDTIFWISADHMALMLKSYRLTLRIRPDGVNQYIGVFDELDIMDSAPTVEQLKNDLAQALKEYAEEYYENFELYVKSPNRQAHLPYVWRILMQENPEGVTKLFDAIME